MNFEQAIVTCFKKYIDFRGRAARSEYWFFALFIVCVRFIIGIVEAIVFMKCSFYCPRIQLSTIASLALFLPQLAVHIRRFHDVNRSGWWAVGLSLIITAALEIFERVEWTGGLGQDFASVLLGAAVLVAGGTQFVWLVSEGSEGDNRFGPDPLKRLRPSSEQ